MLPIFPLPRLNNNDIIFIVTQPLFMDNKYVTIRATFQPNFKFIHAAPFIKVKVPTAPSGSLVLPENLVELRGMGGYWRHISKLAVSSSSGSITISEDAGSIPYWKWKLQNWRWVLQNTPLPLQVFEMCLTRAQCQHSVHQPSPQFWGRVHRHWQHCNTLHLPQLLRLWDSPDKAGATATWIIVPGNYHRPTLPSPSECSNTFTCSLSNWRCQVLSSTTASHMLPTTPLHVLPTTRTLF